MATDHSLHVAGEMAAGERTGLLSEGTGHLEASRWPEAEACFRSILDHCPEDPEALLSLARLHYLTDRIEEARGLLESVLEITPDHPRALCGLGAIHHRQGNLSEAVACLTRSVEVQPGNADAHANLGLVFKQQGRKADAIRHLERALGLDPQHPNSCRILGVMKGDEGDYASALNLLAIPANSPRHDIEALLHLGLYFWKTRRVEEALASYMKVLEIDPDNPLAHLNLSMTFLHCGESLLGWEFYEWRFHHSLSSPLLLEPRGERWSGESGSDLHLLVISEQGLGDALQFIRLAPALRSRVARLTFCAHEKLIPLLQNSLLADHVCSPSEASGLEGYQWLPLLSIPRLLGLHEMGSVTGNPPYLKADADLSKQWASRLGGERTLRVAVHWQGNPEAEKGMLAGRSLPLELLAPLAELPELRLISLQKGAGAEQLESCQFRHAFVAAQDEISAAMSFMDAAAILEQCDLVVTTDTALAHLAGGLGRPTWLLLHHVPDWRWGLEGEQTHWYPSMRLFRQRQPGDWEEVIQRVRSDLAGLLETRRR